MDAQGSCLGSELALLQELDGNIVRGANEGHAAVARRAIDGYARFLQAVAGCIDVVDLKG